MSGFLKLPRDVLDVHSPTAWFPSDYKLACFYAFLVNKANYADGTAPLKYQKVPLKTGQLTTGLPVLAKETAFSIQEIRTLLRRLQNLQKIGMQIHRRGRIITIRNYEELFLRRLDGQQAEQQASNRLPTGSQQHQETERRRENETFPPNPPSADGGDQKEEVSPLGQEAESILRLICPTGPRRKVRTEASRVLMVFGIDVLREIRTYAQRNPSFIGQPLERLDDMCSAMQDHLKAKSAKVIPLAAAKEERANGP